VPWPHYEYSRFLTAAWPYYAGAIGTNTNFLIFATLWLSGEEKGLRKKKGAKME
jgi:oligosaccharyltransferase complex subunit beta